MKPHLLFWFVTHGSQFSLSDHSVSAVPEVLCGRWWWVPFPIHYITFKLLHQLKLRCPSFWSRPTTIPGAIPAALAKQIIASCEKLCCATKELNASCGIRVSRAKESAAFSAASSISTLRFRWPKRMWPISWNKLNQRLCFTAKTPAQFPRYPARYIPTAPS